MASRPLSRLECTVVNYQPLSISCELGATWVRTLARQSLRGSCAKGLFVECHFSLSGGVQKCLPVCMPRCGAGGLAKLLNFEVGASPRTPETWASYKEESA